MSQNPTCMHCDSHDFESCDSSTVDEGQCFPASIVMSCAKPEYTEEPGLVGYWDGEQWIITSESPES